MFYTRYIILIAIAFITINDRVLPAQETNLSLPNNMARFNSLMRINPTRSVDCFNYYLPLINYITKEFERNYNACLKAAKLNRSKVEDATLDKRNQYAALTNNSCNLLKKCSELELPEEVFECFLAGGLQNSKTMYDIRSDASTTLLDLRAALRVIDNIEYKCTNETKRAYEMDFSQSYEEFKHCISGTTIVPDNSKNVEDFEFPEKVENRESSENLNNPENLENPENPPTFESSVHPGNINNSETLNERENSENPENAEISNNPENPAKTGSTENPENAEISNNTEIPNNPEIPSDTESTENPQNTEEPGNPQEPAKPENPNSFESFESIENSENTENPSTAGSTKNPESAESSESIESLDSAGSAERPESKENNLLEEDISLVRRKFKSRFHKLQFRI